jgi:acyl carrier protein phosphodiesterase
VNFFAHALVASWHSPSPAYALGAMLPDLAGMVGARTPAVDHAELAAGVELHHTTDRAFHRLPAFVAAMGEIQRRLMGLGFDRGPAAGAAHVGFELCLDGALLDEPKAIPHYLAALEAAQGDLGAAIPWPDPDCASRWHALVDRLAAWGPPHRYRDLDLVATRVERALASRPRLALAAGQVDLLRQEMADIAARAIAAAPGILRALRAELVP